MVLKSELIKQLEKNLDVEYIKSTLKTFTKEERGIINILHDKEYPLSISQIRQIYLDEILSIIILEGVNRKIIKPPGKLNSYNPFGLNKESIWLSNTDVIKLIEEKDKIEKSAKSKTMKMRNFNKLFSKYGFKVIGDSTIKNKIELLKEHNLITERALEEKSKAKSVYTLNPKFDLLLKNLKL